jgi:hypothetical chaperone protein
MHVIDERLGHRLLGETEGAKIELSQAPRTLIDLDRIERGLAVHALQAELIELLDDLLARLVRTGRAAIAAAGVPPAAVSTLYFTGGSSGMSALRDAFGAAFRESRVVVGDLFGSVVSGLGIDAARRFA